MFADQIECYEAIADALSQAIPEPWDAVQVQVELFEQSVNLLITYTPRGGIPESGNIDYVPTLARSFFELAKLVSTEEKGLYRKCRFTLSSAGEYKTDFQY